MKTTGTIILPEGTTFDVVAKHLVAFALLQLLFSDKERDASITFIV